MAGHMEGYNYDGSRKVPVIIYFPKVVAEGFELTIRFPLTGRPRSAIEPSLQLVSPEKGHLA